MEHRDEMAALCRGDISPVRVDQSVMAITGEHIPSAPPVSALEEEAVASAARLRRLEEAVASAEAVRIRPRRRRGVRGSIFSCFRPRPRASSAHQSRPATTYLVDT